MIEKRTILLVEDNPDDELLTMRAIKKNQIVCNIAVAHDGVEALDFIFGRGKYEDRNVEDFPRLILLDLNLPRIGGLEVLKRIRSDERTQLLPIVILSSSNEERDLIESYKLGANSYIRKPVDFNQFTDTVKQLGFYWLVLNQVPS